MSATRIVETEKGANDAGPPPDRLGRLPSRRVLESLFKSVDKNVPAESALSAIAISTIILAVIAIGFVLHVARPIMLPLTSAFVLSLLLAPAADWLGRRGVPESLRAAIVVFATVTALFAAFYSVGKPAVAWTERLPGVVDEAREKLRGVEDAVTQVQQVSKQVEEIADGPAKRDAPQEVIVRSGSLTSALADSARTMFVAIMFTAVLTYFLLATRSSFRAKAIAARASIPGKLQTARMLRDIQNKVGAYMFTMLIINIGLGIVVGGAMMAIGMPSPFVWGLIAGVLNFVPYLGPAIVTVLLGISGIVHFETLTMAAAAPAIYIVANFIESNFVTPSLVGVRLRISPLAIIVAIAFLTWMWGAVGAVIAIPLVVVAKTMCDAIKPLRPIGVLIGEIEVVKGRKVGFCRIDTVPHRIRPARAKAEA